MAGISGVEGGGADVNVMFTVWGLLLRGTIWGVSVVLVCLTGSADVACLRSTRTDLNGWDVALVPEGYLQVHGQL